MVDGDGIEIILVGEGTHKVFLHNRYDVAYGVVYFILSCGGGGVDGKDLSQVFLGLYIFRFFCGMRLIVPRYVFLLVNEGTHVKLGVLLHVGIFQLFPTT